MANPPLYDNWLFQAGEGLFAIDTLPSGSIVSLFNGIRLKTATVAAQNRAPSDYRIRLNADIDIDIPHECISLEVTLVYHIQGRGIFLARCTRPP